MVCLLLIHQKNVQIIYIITDVVLLHQLKSQTMKTNISEIKERNKDKLFQVSNFSQEPIPSLSILFNKKVGN